MTNPNRGNPYMQGSNPFMMGNGAPPPPTALNPGAPPTGPGVGGGGASETTKPRQMPGGAAPMGMGDPMGAGAQPVNSVAPLGLATSPGQTPQGDAIGTAPAGGSRQVDNMSATSLLRQVRAEIKRDNPDVKIADAHVLALAVVDMIQAEATTPVTPAGRRRQRTQLGDLNDRRNINSPLHPSHPQNPRNQGYYNNDDDQQARPGVRNPLADNAWRRGYTGPHPYAAGAGVAIGEGLANWWKSRKHTGEHPPNEDHDESRQPPAHPDHDAEFDEKHPPIDLSEHDQPNPKSLWQRPA